MADLHLTNVAESLISVLQDRATRHNAGPEEEAIAVLDEALTKDTFEARSKALDLISTEVHRLNVALERNWIIQLIVATVGVAMAFDIGEFNAAISDHFKFKPGPLAIALSAIYFYYFMRFGYLLIRFIPSRACYDNLLNLTLGRTICAQDLDSLRDTSSYFEMFYSNEQENRFKILGYFLFSIVVASAAQASALFLPWQAYQGETWIAGILFVYVAALVFLYISFWVALKNHPSTKLVVIGCICAVSIWIIAFNIAGFPMIKHDS